MLKHKKIGDSLINVVFSRKRLRKECYVVTLIVFKEMSNLKWIDSYFYTKDLLDWGLNN